MSKIITSGLAGGLIWLYKGLLLASPSRGTEFYFTCIFCPTARKRAIYVLLVANSFIKTSTCSSLRSILKAKAFARCLHRQSRWFPYPNKKGAASRSETQLPFSIQNSRSRSFISSSVSSPRSACSRTCVACATAAFHSSALIFPRTFLCFSRL